MREKQKVKQILPMAEEQRNRLWNIRNPFQGNFKKVLCVCSAGMLRSPTAAIVLAKAYGYNTRAVGFDTGHALVPLDQVLLEWADETVCMDRFQEDLLISFGAKNVLNLEIPDQFDYMNPELVQLIEERYPEVYRRYYGVGISRPHKMETEDSPPLKFYMIRYFPEAFSSDEPPEEYYCDAMNAEEALDKFIRELSPEDPPERFTIYETIRVNP